MRQTWDSLKLIWQTMSYAAALTLLGASRVSTNDQWTAILAQWAWMILIVVVGRIGWVVCLQIVEETKKVLREQKAKEYQELSESAGEEMNLKWDEYEKRWFK